MTVLDDLIHDLRHGGVVGVDAQAKAIFLCNISRKLAKPQSYIAYGPSASGKSFLIETIMSLVPSDDVERFDSASEKALFYNKAPLSHRIVYTPEASNLSEELQGHLRVLVSEGQLTHMKVEMAGVNGSVKTIIREGPCLVAQTSVDSIHPENETRSLLIEIPDGPQQTQLVMRSLAAKFSGRLTAIDPTPWQALDLAIPNGVEIIIDSDLTEALWNLLPHTAVRMRRDFGALLTLICAHALLYLQQRPLVGSAYVAGMEDYEAVRDILEPIIGVQTDVKVHPEVREFVETAISLCTQKGLQGTVTAKEVGDVVGIDARAAWRRAKRAMKGEYLKNSETRPRQPAQLHAGGAMPDGVTLPTVEDIREWIVATRGQADSTSVSTPAITVSSVSTKNRYRGEKGNGASPSARPLTPKSVESVETPIKQVETQRASEPEEVASSDFARLMARLDKESVQ